MLNRDKQSNRIFAGILPARMTPFEEYMLMDERPGYSMTTPVCLCFQGKVDVEKLAEAYRITFDNEPLAHAFAKKRFGKFEWIESDTTPLFEINDTNATQDMPDSGIETVPFIDITKDSGIRCVYLKYRNGFMIRLYLHHSIFDGHALVIFLCNWFARYLQLTGDNEDIFITMSDPSRFAKRDDFHITLPRRLSKFTITNSIIQETSRWFLRRPKQLQSSRKVRDDAKNKQQGNTLVYWSLLKNELCDSLKIRAMELGVSLNTLLLCVYCATLCCQLEKNPPIGGVSRDDWVRVLMPVSLRNETHTGLPLANVVGYAFLDRRMRECDTSLDAINRIQSDVRLIKDWAMGSIFHTGLAFIRRVPGLLPLLLSDRFCHSTSVFSNLGNIRNMFTQPRFSKSGNIKSRDFSLRYISAAPPARPNTVITCGLIKTLDAMTISFTADSTRFNNEDVDEFRRTYIDKLHEVTSQCNVSSIPSQNDLY